MELGKERQVSKRAWCGTIRVRYFTFRFLQPLETLDKDFSGKDPIYTAGTKSNSKNIKKPVSGQLSSRSQHKNSRNAMIIAAKVNVKNYFFPCWASSAETVAQT